MEKFCESSAVKHSVNVNKLHAALAMLASATLSVGAIVLLIKLLA